ncbi:LacI family DNA-binding transcriptional regulator [Agromyces sp. NPDC058064]|uniref:LacI family DNA-binding transcriptional regulator n=1 Tax=Agromyces sp. NPDC058064 TaxID=3346322 RepID=UPI0036DB95B4
MNARSGKQRTRVTLREVAAHARVSVATASNVLSGSVQEGARYSDETAERVRQSAVELKYLPNRMARSVRTGRTRVIQLVLHMLGDPWTLSLAEAFTQRAPEYGLTTLIAMDSDFASALARSEFDAAFVAAADATESTQWRDALGPLARKVAVYASDLEPDGFDVIRFDERGAARMAVEHLIEHHRAIACLSAVSGADEPHGGPRRQVYIATMAEAGLPIPDGYIVEYERNLLDPYRGARSLLDRPDPPTAVFAETDFAAFAAVQTARELGLRVPEDVAIIGIGDSGQAEQAGISSIGAVDMRAQIVDFVLARALDSETPANRVLDLKPALFARRSTLAE